MQHHQIATEDVTIHVAFTDVSDGDFQIDSDSEQLAANRAQIVDMQWSWPRQTHSNKVVTVTQPSGFVGEADGLITRALNTPISVTTADCVPLVLVAADAVGVVHAGWRGLQSQIVQKCAHQMRASGSTPIKTLLGPHIHVADYAFSPEDLQPLAESMGPTVVGRTSSNEPAFDMFQAVLQQCNAASLQLPEAAENTSSGKFFSHRVRQDAGRQATVAWITQND